MSFPRYKHYKDSGVEWLGEVPEHWKLGKLHHIAILNPAKAELGDIDPQTAISFLPMEAFGTKGDPSLSLERTISQVETGYTYFRDGDVAFAKVTPCFENGKRAIFSKLTNGIGFGTTELIVLRARSGQTVPKFLYWLVATSEFLGLGEGSMYGAGGLKRIPESFVHQFSLCIPGIDEQTFIVTFLDQETAKIDALIEEQRLLIELLKEKRQAVISHAVTKGLNPNARFKDSGVDLLGNVPAQWVPMTVTRIIERIEQGWSPDCFARQADTEEWGVVKSGCVNRGVFAETQNKALPAELDPNPEYEIKPGDVLMSRASGSPELVGSTALVTETRPRLMLSDKIFRICLEESISKEYFVALFNSKVMRSQIERAISGAGGLANNLPQSALKSFWFALPPRHEQDLIALYIARQTGEIDALVKEAELAISFLEERRTSTVSAAITGKIDVRAYMAKPVMSATQYSSGFAHQLLAAEILDRCNSQRMGRIKLQKLIHLCEYHGRVNEVQGDYSRKAAGPFDAKAMAGISKNLKKQKWFEEVKEGERYVYRPLEKRGEHKKYLAHWQAEMPRIDEVLSLLGNFRTRECEIVSTLYAAWNDLLIDGGPTDDGAILHEASSAERWHKSKEQIAPERWKKALQWMKDKGLVPVGYGKHTRHTAVHIGIAPEVTHEPA